VTTSTQEVALVMAERGAADRTVVVADTQTAGRGRRGRRWHDAPGESLLASIIVRPRLSVPDLPKLSLTAAVAVGEALERAASLSTRLKWPNDVLVGGRKIAGILLESRIAAAPLVVVGVGINLGQRSFPGALGRGATSVALETGRVIAPQAMLEALLPSFDAWRARLEGDGFAAVRRRWLELTETIGRALEADGQTGVAVDLGADGALVLRAPDGLRRVLAGEVSPAAGVSAGGGRD
jgi:BirA family biotin operon repressor/biotin-[acetyl-CoA-carboxylase] ligase